MKILFIILIWIEMLLGGFDIITELHRQNQKYIDTTKCSIIMSGFINENKGISYEDHWGELKSSGPVIFTSLRDENGRFYQQAKGAKGSILVYSNIFKLPNGESQTIYQKVMVNGIDKNIPDWFSIPDKCRTKYLVLKIGESIQISANTIFIKESKTRIKKKFDINTGITTLLVVKGFVYILK